MIIILCLDNNNGMLFHQRRQSRDKLVIENIIETFQGHLIHINSFSKILFEEFPENIIIDENFLSNSCDTDICFVENEDISKYEDKISKIIVYQWNRDYPFDVKCNIDFSQYQLTSVIEFKGNSHSVITREEYSK